MSKLKKRARKKRARKRRREKFFLKLERKKNIISSKKEKRLRKIRASFSSIDLLLSEYEKLFAEKANFEYFIQDFSERVLSDSHWKAGEEYQKGILSEYYVLMVLRKLKDEQKINTFFQSQRYGSLDLKKIDFELVLVNGKHFFFPLQVKSSSAMQKKHIKDHRDIASVVATIDLSKLKEKINRIIDARKIRGEILHL